jgi:hypothetical protein
MEVSMTIQVVAQGLVVGEPVALAVEDDSATVLLLQDACACDEPVEYEVFCRDPDLAQLVLERVRRGDLLVVTGLLRLHRVLGPVEDEVSAARVVLDAATVGRHIGSDPDPSGCDSGTRPHTGTGTGTRTS